MHKPLALLIPISEHNIAQLYNCLAIDADAVVLMASKNFIHHRTRFIGVLQSIKPNTTILKVELPQDAEDYAVLHQFAIEQLQPLSAEYRLELNGTGGTKVIPMVLIDTLPICKVHYKGQSHNYLQSWQPGKANSYTQLNLPSAIPVSKALALYTNKTASVEKKLNIFAQDPSALAIAEAIWQQYQYKDSAMSWLAASLSKSAWVDQNASTSTVVLLIPKERQDCSEWQDWFRQLAIFSNGQLSYQVTELHLKNSQRKKHPANQFKRWLSGDWLEQLVESWLREQLPEAQLMCGVKPSATGEQGDSRELDFLFFHHTAGYVIETKVTTEPHQPDTKMVQQLSSIADHFGKLRKILLLSPLFFQQKNENELKQFEHYCQGHGVTLCRSKAELDKLLN